MQHLKKEELIDLAEGTRPESAVPHLASCEFCRVQLADLRAVMSVAAAVEVPEPSPLFWDHFSARVRHAVASEAPGENIENIENIENDESEASRWPARLWTWRALVPAAGFAALVLAAVVVLRAPSEGGKSEPWSAGAPSMVEAGPGPDPVNDVNVVDVAARVDDDPSLSLLADLAAELDWDDAVEAGLTDAAGSLDRVVTEMTNEERLELQRILKEELSSGSQKSHVRS